MTRLFVAHIRPLLDYVSPIWFPNSVELINGLEGVQRKYTKRIPSILPIFRITITSHILVYNVLKLQDCSDLLFLSKLKFGLTHLTFADFSVNTSRLCTNRFISPTYLSIVNFNFFVSRTIRMWNALDNNVTNAIHYLQFRRLLLLINFTTY